jgi:hypothetical protein
MEDNYLWDRSGEADPEIQKLEELLGTLRYQPRALEIPHHIQVGRHRSFLAPIAIAAAIALLAVLLGLWFGFNRRQTPALEAKKNLPVDQPLNPAPAPLKPDNPPAIATLVKIPRRTEIEKHREAPRNLEARNRNSMTRTATRQSELTADELAEKEQVLVALRLVSYKLNLAQRKTQGGPQPNTIRNQHKIG